MDDVGLAAGRTQREKKRSYKDLLREEEETAAQVRKSSKKWQKDNEPIFSVPDTSHKKKKKLDDSEYGDFSPPELAKKKKLGVTCSPSDNAMDLLKSITAPVTGGSNLSKKLEKSPSSSSSSSSSFSPPGYPSYPEGRKEHKKKKNGSDHHSPLVADDSLPKPKKLKTALGSTETLTLREPDGLKMKLIVSPKEESIPTPIKSSKKPPLPIPEEVSGSEPQTPFSKSSRKKIKLESQTLPLLSSADSQRQEATFYPPTSILSEMEKSGMNPLDTGSSSGGEPDGCELVIDDSSRGSKKKKKSKKSKKKKDKDKHREERHKDDKHKEEKHKEDKHKEEKRKEDRHKDIRRKEEKRSKEEKRKEDRHKEDRHKEDRHKEDRHKEDRHKEDRHKEDRHKEDRHKEDRRKEDKRKEDKHKEDKHKEEKRKDDKHKEEKRKEEKHREDKHKEDKHKEDKHREEKQKDDRHKEEKHKDEKHKDEKNREEKHKDEKHKDEKRKEDKHKEKKHSKLKRMPSLVAVDTMKGPVVLSTQPPATSMPLIMPQLHPALPLPPPPPPPVLQMEGQIEKKKKKEEKAEKLEKPKKKNMTAYQVFCKEYRVNIIADQPGLDFGELSKKLAEVWKQMAEKDKLVWKQRAQYLQHKQNKAEATTVKRKSSSSEGTSKNRGLSLSPHKKSPSSLLALSSSPVKVPETQPIDVAAHLQLLGDSMSVIGRRLQETEGMVAVSGSLSVLLDSILCALGPLVCLSAQVPQLNICPKEVLSNTLDNIAYIMPGL